MPPSESQFCISTGNNQDGIFLASGQDTQQPVKKKLFFAPKKTEPKPKPTPEAPPVPEPVTGWHNLGHVEIGQKLIALAEVKFSREPEVVRGWCEPKTIQSSGAMLTSVMDGLLNRRTPETETEPALSPEESPGITACDEPVSDNIPEDPSIGSPGMNAMDTVDTVDTVDAMDTVNMDIATADEKTVEETAGPAKEEKISLSSQVVEVKGTPGDRPFIALGRERFYFRDRPVANIDGSYYISAGDGDFDRLFRSMGLTYSWLSYSGKLFIFLPHGSVDWQVSENTARVGDENISVPATARKNFDGSYIPIKSLAKLLDLKITQVDGGVELRPGVRLATIRGGEGKGIDIQLISSMPVNYQVKYQASPPAVRLSIPGAAFNDESKKFFVEGVQVRVNDEVDPETLFITMEFPQHWKGEIIGSIHKSQVAVRMKPNIVYAWGTTNEALRTIEATRTDENKLYMEFETTGPVQYYWSYDPDEGILFVDLPFALPEPGLAFGNMEDKFIKCASMETLRIDNIPITRLRMELAEKSAFTIGSPEKQKESTFALLIGPADLIGEASPHRGSSRITYADALLNNLIVIDPGHGGSDPGAVNSKLGLKESDIVLDISKHLAEMLTSKGYRVIMTRHTDTDLTYPGSPNAEELMARSNVANNNNAALFVSVHCNASVSDKLRGSSYHWYKPEDYEVAKAFTDSLGPNIGTICKGPRKDKFFVLNHTRVPSVLVECAFLSNPQDAKILACGQQRIGIARRLASSIDMWFRNKNLARTAKPVGSDE